MEYAVVELIKLSQHHRVIADVSMRLALLTEISDADRIACLMAPPHMVTCAQYGAREDHKEFLDCLLSLKEPEKKIAVQDELFRLDVERIFDEVRQYGLFSVVREPDSTVEHTIQLLEQHFAL